MRARGLSSTFLAIALGLPATTCEDAEMDPQATADVGDPDDADTVSGEDDAPDATNDGAECAGDPFGQDFMTRVLGVLAQPAWEGRRFDSDGLEQAMAWVASMFECVGLEPGAGGLPGLPEGSFEQPFETDADDTGELPEGELEGPHAFTNLLGHIPGAGALASEFIVVGAHLDHLGETEDGLILGADDNASGVLALFALAKSLTERPPTGDRRTLVFAAWGVEEDPFYRRGSAAFLDAIAEADPSGHDAIMHYVNFDMIGGYDRDADGTPQVYALGTPEGSAARSAVERARAQVSALTTTVGWLGAQSDQVSFCLEGIPYVFFWTNDANYHTPADTPENLDFEHLPSILRLAEATVRELATAPDLAGNKAAFDPDELAKSYGGADCEFEN